MGSVDRDECPFDIDTIPYYNIIIFYYGNKNKTFDKSVLFNENYNSNDKLWSV